MLALVGAYLILVSFTIPTSLVVLGVVAVLGEGLAVGALREENPFVAIMTALVLALGALLSTLAVAAVMTLKGMSVDGAGAPIAGIALLATAAAAIAIIAVKVMKTE